MILPQETIRKDRHTIRELGELKEPQTRTSKYW